MRAAVPDRLSEMLTRLKLTGIRDQLDGLLDEAGRQELSLRETLVLLCEREIARKDERRIEMTLKLARFPFVRDLLGFDFASAPVAAFRSGSKVSRVHNKRFDPPCPIWDDPIARFGDRHPPFPEPDILPE
jgi:DNA replication protein DnaC